MADERKYIKQREDVINLGKELDSLTKKQEGFFKSITTSGDKFEDVVDTAKELSKVLTESNKYSKKNNDLADNQVAAAKLGLNLGKRQTIFGKIKNLNALNELKAKRATSDVEDEITDGIIEQVESQYEQVDLAKEFGNALTDADSIFGGMGATIKSALSNPLAAAAAILATFNDQQETIAKQFGGIGVKDFRKELAGASQNFVRLGLSSEDAQSSISQIANDFGIGVSESSKLSENVARIAASTGMSVEDSTKLVGLFTQTQGLTGQQAEDLLLGTRQLAKANNVAPDKVLSDIAADTEVFARFSKDGGENLLRAAVQARALGINLSTVAKAADGLLDFQNSLNAEIEASILLGREVNLQKARELSLNNDIEGLQKELVKQVGTEAEFNKLNRIERDALARAMSMEVSEIQKLVSNQKEQKTLQGEINRLTAENEIPEDTITGVAEILADFKSIGMQLAESIGPSLNSVLKLIAGITGALAETKLLLPAIGILLGAMVTKSAVLFALQAGATYASAVKFLGIGGLAALLAAPLVIGGLVGGVMSVASAKEGGITTREGLVNIHPQEAIVPIEKLGGMIKDVISPMVHPQEPIIAIEKLGGMTNDASRESIIPIEKLGGMIKDAMKPVVEENKRMREQNDTLIAETRRQAGRFADAMVEVG